LGTSNGLELVWVVINMERSSVWQAQTDVYLGNLGVGICGNDYTATTTRAVRDLFAPPSPSNPDPRPVFVVINCLTNSPNHAYREVLVNEFYAGGGALDFSGSIANWRGIIDAVQAPPPRLSGARASDGAFEFTFPGQRGRTNRVEASGDLVHWATVTNVFGSNGPVLIRDPAVLPRTEQFYRVVRP
jgi:hypothetical protein